MDIIFDLGGVLIDWNPRYLYRKIFADEAAMERFLSGVTTPDWNEEQDAGRPLQEATEWLVARHPEQEAEIRAFYGRWDEMLAGPIEGTVYLLRELKERGDHRLFALTNWSAETWPVAWERYDFLRWFGDILVSGRERMRKPEERFYRLMEERFGIRLEESLFIDDNLRNVEAARRCGLETLHFESPEKLRRELEERGLI